MQNLTIFDTHVELKLPTGVTKAISLPDFKGVMDTVLGSSEADDLVFLPSNCYYFSKTGLTIKLACYHPEAKRKVEFASNRASKPTKMNIPFPNIIINFVLKKVGDRWSVNSAKYLCTNKKLSQLPLRISSENDEGVWISPLPNTYAGGNMCYGTNSMPSGFLDNFRGLDWYFQFLFSTPFNSDLGIPSVAGSSSSVSWMKVLSESKEFPYDKLTGK